MPRCFLRYGFGSQSSALAPETRIPPARISPLEFQCDNSKNAGQVIVFFIKPWLQFFPTSTFFWIRDSKAFLAKDTPPLPLCAFAYSSRKRRSMCRYSFFCLNSLKWQTSRRSVVRSLFSSRFRIHFSRFLPPSDPMIGCRSVRSRCRVCFYLNFIAYV